MPTIVPFTFGDEELNLDESISAMCSITKGDSPISIWWKFNGEGSEGMSYNLTTNDGIVITRTSQKVSMLAIDSVKARHRGNYTCFASNKGGYAQHSAYLAINGSMIMKKTYKLFFNLRLMQFASDKFLNVVSINCVFKSRHT